MYRKNDESMTREGNLNDDVVFMTRGFVPLGAPVITLYCTRCGTPRLQNDAPEPCPNCGALDNPQDAPIIPE